MTERCRILILLGLTGSLLGMLRNQSALTVLSLSVLLWILGAWVIFSVRLGWIWPRLNLIRQINGRPQLPTILWVGRKVDVMLTITAPRLLKLPGCLLIRDLLPAGLSIEQGQASGSLTRSSREIVLHYAGRCPAAGTSEWFGVHFRFQDPQGLFVEERVIRQRQAFRVLPAYTPAGDAKSLIKRTNSIPQQGIHQLKRSGLGAELLELTEYQPGDPPKSIAWKVSARRGQLMTRQYESEVPIRMTFLVDDGQTMRDGVPGERPLDEAIQLAASMAKAAVGLGDSVGVVCTSADNETYHLRPAAGDRAFYQVLERLAEFSAHSPNPPQDQRSLSGEMLRTAIDLAEERYPELLEPRLETAGWSPFPLRPSRRRGLRSRRRLATVLADIYQLSASQLVEMTHDSQLLSKYARRWLDELGIATERLRSTQDSPQHLSALARALTKAVALAKDNEVFVLFTDILLPTTDFTDALDLDPAADELMRAAKMALSRHHRLVFICPLPHAGSTRDAISRTLDDVGREVLQIQTARRAKALQRHLRSMGATTAFMGQQKVVATVMAEAELAGSGRFTAGANR